MTLAGFSRKRWLRVSALVAQPDPFFEESGHLSHGTGIIHPTCCEARAPGNGDHRRPVLRPGVSEMGRWLQHITADQCLRWR